jgi:hypothetical protein
MSKETKADQLIQELMLSFQREGVPLVESLQAVLEGFAALTVASAKPGHLMVLTWELGQKYIDTVCAMAPPAAVAADLAHVEAPATAQ